MEFLMLSVLYALFLNVVGQQQPAPVFYPCPFQGPAYPRPNNVATNAAVKAACQNTTAVINGALQAGLIDNETTAFSVTAFSTSDKNSIPFYTFHQTPPLLSQAPLGVRKVTDQTVYRLGSLSKVFTVYTLLVADGFKHFQDSITKFVPGLTKANTGHDPITSTDWDDITLQALASHMGGIGVEYGVLDIAKSPFPFTEAGLPQVPKQQLPPCGGPLKSPLCTRQQFIQGIANKHPVFPPFYSPSYSNAAFQLLGYAIQSITGQTFPDVLKRRVFSVLNMTTSFYDRPSDALGVIPGDPTVLLWNVSAGDLGPAAGIYSSPHDVAVFGRAILSSQQLTPVQTRRWMKPVTHTSDPFASVGAPWEISRYTLPNDPYRTIDLYAKSGGFGYYSAYIILVPDYNVGFSVNVAGSGAALGPLANVITESLLPALEEASRNQADADFAGHYATSDKQYSFTLSTSRGAPGLRLTNFTGPKNSNEFATLAVLASVAAGRYDIGEQALPFIQNGSASVAYEQGLFGVEIDLRLFPTTLQDKTNGIQRVSFRAAQGLSLSGQIGPFTAACGTWEVIDTVELGGRSFDEFIFHLDAHGEATAVEHPFLRETFARVA